MLVEFKLPFILFKIYTKKFFQSGILELILALVEGIAQQNRDLDEQKSKESKVLVLACDCGSAVENHPVNPTRLT